MSYLLTSRPGTLSISSSSLHDHKMVGKILVVVCVLLMSGRRDTGGKNGCHVHVLLSLDGKVYMKHKDFHEQTQKYSEGCVQPSQLSTYLVYAAHSLIIKIPVLFKAK